METINSLIESFYYRLFLVASHEGESIQPYYRHNHEEAENYYQQRAQELLEENDTIPLLDIDELIWERDINFPEPEEFASILQTEDQNFETPISQKKSKWSMDEDRVLFRELQMHGKQWTLISRSLPGRSPDSVKKRSESKTFTNRLSFFHQELMNTN